MKQSECYKEKNSVRISVVKIKAESIRKINNDIELVNKKIADNNKNAIKEASKIILNM